MEYLRDLFHDNLNADGEVKIYSSKFYRDDVLKTMDEEAYNQAFIDWQEERKTSLLEKADEILEKYDNRDRFIKLQHIYLQGNVSPFVGAGMSMSSGYAGWTSFLYKLRKETMITEEELSSLIVAGKYEEAAQKLFDAMPTNAFNEALDNEYGNNKSIYGPVQYLPYVFNSIVITTNFDNVLKRCYDEAGKHFSEILLGAEAEELPRLMKSSDALLLKLHGKANSGRKRVLTKDEYDAYYSASNTLPDIMEIICTNSLLFLGSSLSVDRTIRSMIELVKTKGHENIARHYAFVGLKDESERLERRDQLVEANIFPIWYDANDDHDECIEALLVKLKEEVR